LGCSYFNGDGVANDKVEAVKWWRKAAEHGYASAQNNLGICYRDGAGVAKDEVEAVAWYRKAAEQGDALAQYNLGYSYFYGKGVAKDELEAYAYFNLVGITSEDARKVITLIEKDLSPDARLRGQQRTKELQREIAGRSENLRDLQKEIEREKMLKGG
jgi:hypothetical protein